MVFTIKNKYRANICSQYDISREQEVIAYMFCKCIQCNNYLQTDFGMLKTIFILPSDLCSS